ncbi:undecaprenyl-diphosphate phosphatase [Brevibacillus dissolubilis]|uniref:undecaprenyl-diphosphate phosphatase n=1 Tax=Brevibacillus dissolubilis TaxID=1844116 RepID=UPI0011173DCF|nr:undecaprenyl-diphosphate phosphatase [Brevibacillus dissolubilis]
MLELLEHIILGIVQGLTEFLPISSTGHLVLFGKLFGLREAGLLFDTLLHIGTFVAVVIVFWGDILHMLKNPTSRLVRLLIVGTIPTGIIALTFKDYFEEISQTGATIGYEFIATGIILWAVESIRKGSRNFEQINYMDAFIVGTLQGAAILPAISRSGLTIAGALLRGIDRADAARFSFLISLPAILGATVLQVKELAEAPVLPSNLSYMLIGAVFAAIFGYVAVRWMIKLISNGSMKVFAYYVWVLGAVILIMQALGKW